jgi:hypothetical protein
MLYCNGFTEISVAKDSAEILLRGRRFASSFPNHTWMLLFMTIRFIFRIKY